MILIRNCSGFDELEACVQLQIETWGYDDSDVIPRKAFLVGQKIGGQVIGAFDTELPGALPNGSPESLVGFAMSLPGVKPGTANLVLICTRTCWQCAIRIATEVSVHNSSCSSDLKPLLGTFT